MRGAVRSDEKAQNRTMNTNRIRAGLAAATLVALSGCAVDSGYQLPSLSSAGGGYSTYGPYAGGYYGYGSYYGPAGYAPLYYGPSWYDPRYSYGWYGPNAFGGYPYYGGSFWYPGYVYVPCVDQNRDGRCDRHPHRPGDDGQPPGSGGSTSDGGHHHHGHGSSAQTGASGGGVQWPTNPVWTQPSAQTPQPRNQPSSQPQWQEPKQPRHEQAPWTQPSQPRVQPAPQPSSPRHADPAPQAPRQDPSPRVRDDYTRKQ